MVITFATNLLSAQSTGNPNLTNTTLSGVGVTILSAGVSIPQYVVVVSLSAPDVGIAFNPVTYTIPTQSLSTFDITAYPVNSFNVNGSVFLIPSLMEQQTVAVVNNNVGDCTTFTVLSTVLTVPVSSLSQTRDAMTPNRKRLWLYGYI